jgi:hypothetical protein
MNTERLLDQAHKFLLFAVMALILFIILAYPMESLLPMPVLILAHIGTLLAATTIKLAYITRLYALKKLGLAVN